MKWPFQLAQFSRTQGVALEVTSYKVPASASASFNVSLIATCLIASGRPGFDLILSPEVPPTSDDFKASYAVTPRGFVIYLPWKRLRGSLLAAALQLFAETIFSMVSVWFWLFSESSFMFYLNFVSFVRFLSLKREKKLPFIPSVVFARR